MQFLLQVLSNMAQNVSVI